MFEFGIGYSELFLLLVIAVIAIGPKDMPRVLRMYGQFMGKLRGYAREFQGQVDVAMKEAGAADLKKDLAAVKSQVNTAITFPDGMQTANSVTQLQQQQRSKDFVEIFGSEKAKGAVFVQGEQHFVDDLVKAAQNG